MVALAVSQGFPRPVEEFPAVPFARMPSGEGTREVKGKQWTYSQQETSAEESEEEVHEPYTLKQFNKLWRRAENVVGDLEEIEDKKEFRNTHIKSNERYGRILPRGMKVGVACQRVAFPR